MFNQSDKNEIETSLTNENLLEIAERIIGLEDSGKIVDQNIFDDLEIFRTNDPDQVSVFSRIDHTCTRVGFVCLKNIILSPTDNTQTLLSRQKLITRIMKDVSMSNQLKKSLEKLKVLEEDVLWHWVNHEPELKEWYRSVYFNSWIFKPLNKFPIALDAKNKYMTIISPLIYIVSPIISILIAYITLRLMGIRVSIVNFIGAMRFSADLAPRLLAGMGILPRAIMNLRQIGPFVWLFMYFQGMYQIVTSALDVNKVNRRIYQRVSKTVEYIKEAYVMQEILSKIGIDVEKDCDINRCLKNRDSGEYSILKLNGSTLKDFDRIANELSDLSYLIKFVGTADAFHSISSLLLLPKQSYTPSIYTLKKEVITKGLFHPSIGAERSITNDLDMGGSIILTGPNGSGKSTVAKGIGLAALLSQTITVVNASYIEIPVFSFINTYLNIPDCQGKESLFQAELRRCLYNINRMKMLSKDQMSLLIMDEIFTGTNFKEGLSAAYAICNYLCKVPNNLTFATTHYKFLTTIEKKLPWPNGFRNFMMNTCTKNKYTYTIQQGSSSILMAIDMMETYGFPKSVVNDARKIVKRLNSKKYI